MPFYQKYLFKNNKILLFTQTIFQLIVNTHYRSFNEHIKTISGYRNKQIDKLSYKSLAITKIICNFA